MRTILKVLGPPDRGRPSALFSSIGGQQGFTLLRGEENMTRSNTSGVIGCILFALCSLLTSSSLVAHCDGNHTGNHPHCNGGGSSGGDQDPIFTAVGEDLSTDPPTALFSEVDSHSLDPGDVIVYRNVTMDLTGFDNLTGCSHGVKTGTLSTKPKSSEDPQIAVVRFGYRSLLESGKEAHHILVMEGSFRDQYNWPPSVGNPATLYDFFFWDLAAEQRKARRSDCAGNSIDDGLGGDWELTVIRQPE